jgi:hypothetical protein
LRDIVGERTSNQIEGGQECSKMKHAKNVLT